MSVSNVPGRGRKYCAACGKYVGVRSKTCPNCSASFESSIRAAKPVSPEVDSALKSFLKQHAREQRVESQPVQPVEKPRVVVDVPEKGSRIERINSLKRELIKELKNSSRGYSVGVLDEISKAVLTDWE